MAMADAGGGAMAGGKGLSPALATFLAADARAGEDEGPGVPDLDGLDLDGGLDLDITSRDISLKGLRGSHAAPKA